MKKKIYKYSGNWCLYWKEGNLPQIFFFSSWQQAMDAASSLIEIEEHLKVRKLLK